MNMVGPPNEPVDEETLDRHYDEQALAHIDGDDGRCVACGAPRRCWVRVFAIERLILAGWPLPMRDQR